MEEIMKEAKAIDKKRIQEARTKEVAKLLLKIDELNKRIKDIASGHYDSSIISSLPF